MPDAFPSCIHTAAQLENPYVMRWKTLPVGFSCIFMLGIGSWLRTEF